MKTVRLFALPGLAVLGALTLATPARAGFVFTGSTFSHRLGAPVNAEVFLQLNPANLESGHLNPQPLSPGGELSNLSDVTHPLVAINDPAGTDGNFIYIGMNLGASPVAFHLKSVEVRRKDKLKEIRAVIQTATSDLNDNLGNVAIQMEMSQFPDANTIVVQAAPNLRSDFSDMIAISFQFKPGGPEGDPPFTAQFDVLNQAGEFIPFQAAVPEPGSMALLGIAGGALASGALARRVRSPKPSHRHHGSSS
jgi:hypothetical protein